MAKKRTLTNDEIQKEVNKQIQEYWKQYAIDHTPVVSTKHGHTYVSINKYDHDSYEIIQRIETLLDLMKIEYSSSLIVVGEEFFLSIEGEDADRAAYIQKFIDNGYALKWR